MTNASMTPGSRPRRGVIGVLALLGAGALATAVALAAGEAGDPPGPAGAVELTRFASCEDLAAWGEEVAGGGEDGFDMAGGDDAAEEASVGVAEAAPDAAANATGGGGGRASEGLAGTSAPAGPATTGAFDDGTDRTVAAEAGPDGAAGSDAGSGEDEDAGSGEDEAGSGEDEAGSGEDEAGSGEDEAGSGEDEAGAEDETNVAVEGVDEIDLVDRLTEDVVLVASARRMAVVDLAAAEVVEGVAVPWDAQVTYDADTGVAWAVGHPDAGGVVVDRFAVDVDGLESQGRWTTAGRLVDARRVGDELHVVATDGFAGGPVPDDISGAGRAEGGSATALPFDDGPVPCDEVLHPAGPSDPTATLLVTLPATGAVEPVRATEVVGSGSLVHVTTGAIYLATPQWEAERTTTGIHRFDLASLEPTGSGTVVGTLLDQFSMSEHDGVLRVAVTEEGVGFGVAVEDGVANPVAPVAPPLTGTVGPGPDRAGEGLNEIVVLDTEGALDPIGRTERFGHPGETLHGVRFAGTTAYAVTFLQTDPFYVVDLSDPAAPRVVGEVELPGFSSYLHPLGDGLVVGFGPGADGRAAAKLFDVSDPTQPAVVGDLVLGDESAATSDHHAYLDLGDGRFAVPATTYGGPPEGLTPAEEDAALADGGGTRSAVVVVDTAGGRLVEEARHEVPTIDLATRVLTVDDGWALLAGPDIALLDAAGEPAGRITL